MTFIPLEKLHCLHDGYQQAFDVHGRKLLLIQHAGKPLLLENHCPHAGYSLETARIEVQQLRCPLHGITFSLSDGMPLPEYRSACQQSLKFINLSYDNNRVGILLET